MHLKITSPIGTYRFNAQGEAIAAITEPFIVVEVNNRETLECLYDQNHEHLSRAFQYDENGDVVGMDPASQNAIRDFMLNTEAWYFAQPLDPSEDPLEAGTLTTDMGKGKVSESVSNDTPEICDLNPEPQDDPLTMDTDTGSEENSDTMGSGTTGICALNPAQQALLRQLNCAVTYRMRLRPGQSIPWSASIQNLLICSAEFGLSDPEINAQDTSRGYELAMAKEQALIGEAIAMQIPEEIIASTVQMAEARFSDPSISGDMLPT